MLNDTDEWPVVCPECGHESQERIGRLKNKSSFTCPRCGFVGEFHAEAFIKMLEQLKNTISGAARTAGLFKKKS
jgi:transposase-like protein